MCITIYSIGSTLKPEESWMTAVRRWRNLDFWGKCDEKDS